MGQGDSGIPYVTKSWGPWRGCRPVSVGCDNCYGKREMLRWKKQNPHQVVRAADGTFYAPLKWPGRQRVFVCPWSDFFIEDADYWRVDAWEVVRDTPHYYLFVTKRPERIEWGLSGLIKFEGIAGEILERNWFIVTAENQEMADLRVPIVVNLKKRGVIKNIGVSAEPLLGPINVKPWIEQLDWIVIGAESLGNGAGRECQWNWVDSLIYDGAIFDVPCYVKQLHIDGKLSRKPSEWPEALRVQEFPESMKI